MIEFNPQKKERLTTGECLDPIFKIHDKEEAMQYKRDYIAYIQKAVDERPQDFDGMTAEEVANSNIGYYAGYGTHEDRARIEDLFECKHPIFGSIKENGQPSPVDAFTTGLFMAEESKSRKL